MSDAHLAATLALCAALASAIGNVIRQRSAQEVTDERVGHLTLFGMLLRDKRWWLGGLGDIGSYVLLAAALDKGSVLLVMSLQVTALLFALPIYARMTGNPITGREWTGHWCWRWRLPCSSRSETRPAGSSARRCTRGSWWPW